MIHIAFDSILRNGVLAGELLLGIEGVCYIGWIGKGTHR